MKSLLDILSSSFELTPLREIVRDISIYGFTRIASVLIGLISIPIFALIMAPDAFGIFSLALLTITLATRVVNEWSRSSILRYDAKYMNTDEYVNYLSTAIFPTILLGILFSILFAIIWISTDIFRGYNEYVLISICTFLLSVINTLLITLLRVRQKAKKFSLLQILNRIGNIIFGVLLVLIFRLGGEGMIYGMFITLAITLPLSMKWTNIASSIHLTKIDRSKLKKYLAYGIPLTLFALAIFLMRYTDRYMISKFRNMEEVGLYSYAALFPQRTIEMLIGIIALGAFPIIVREWESDNKQEAVRVTSGLARYHMLLNIPVIGLLLLFPRQIISIVGTSEYLSAYSAVPPLTVASYFIAFAWFSSISFQLSTRTGILLGFTSMAVIVNITLNLYTVPKFGFIGAAFSTMLTSILYFFSVFLYSRRWLPWRIKLRSILSFALAAIVCSVVVLFLKTVLPDTFTSFIMLVSIYVIIYFLLLQIFREFSIMDIIRKITN